MKVTVWSGHVCNKDKTQSCLLLIKVHSFTTLEWGREVYRHAFLVLSLYSVE